MWAFFSVVVICSTQIVLLALWRNIRASEREHRDTSKLADHLEAELKAMKDLKLRMEQLMLRQGLGR